MAELVADTFRETIDKTPDGLVVVQRAGRVTGADSGTYFDGTIVPAFLTAYPAVSYAHRQQTRFNAARNVLIYSVRAAQFPAALPTAAGVSALEGRSQSQAKVDKLGRKVVVSTYDLAYTGDGAALAASLRPAGSGVVVVDESVEFVDRPARRLRAVFQTLAGAAQVDLLDWADSLVEAMTQPDSAQWTYTQSGSAVGRRKFPQPPAFVLGGTVLPLQLTYSRLNDVEWRTAWRYQQVFTTRQAVAYAQLVLLDRPSSPTFIEAP